MLSEGLLNAVDNVVAKHAEENQVVNTVNIQQNLDIFYQKLEEEGFDLTELKPILECPDDMLVLACAGAGKTTMLVLKLIHDFISGEALKPVNVPDGLGGYTTVIKPVRILVGTFLKSGAEDLRANFFRWCKKLGIRGISSESITFCTLHKEFIEAIKSFGGNVRIIEDSVVTDIVRGLMREYNIHQQGSYSKTITVEEVNDIKGLLTYCRNRLDDEKFKHPLLREYGIDEVILSNMLARYNITLDAYGQLDFEATQELLYKYLQINPAIAEALKNRYDFVFVDEFQDTSQLQYAILKLYFEGAMKKIVIGDDDQTIYSWRGSDIDIIVHKFEEDFKPTLMPLTTNHRCPDKILAPVVPSIMLNENRHPKRLRSSKDGGEVSVLYNVGADELISSINEDLSKYESVGIISRTNNDLLIPAMLLELGCGVDFQISKSVSLNAKMPKSICSSIDLITKRYTVNFETILKSIFPRHVYSEVSMLCSILSANPQLSMFTIDSDDLDASVPNIAPFIRGIQKAKQADGDIAAFAYILEYMIRVTFVKNTNYCIKARTFTEFIKSLVLDSELTANMDIHAIDRLLNAELPNRIASRNKPIADPRIKLTTVHDAKGKEWDAVYIWNDIDGTFPSAMARENSDDEYEEERRLHYIAWTRAKHHLTVCTSTLNPSPFLNECTIPNVAIKQETAESIGKMSVPTKVTPESIRERVSNFILGFVNKTGVLESDKSVKEDLDILLGFVTVAEVIDSVMEWVNAMPDLNYKNNDFIRVGIATIAQDMLEAYSE